MSSNKIVARTFGIFFLIAFLSYGIGSGLTGMGTECEDMLSYVSTGKTQFITGIVLMALVHTIVNIGLPVLMVPILKTYNKTLSIGYLSAGITATVIVIVGAIFSMLQVPLSDMYKTAESSDILHYETLSEILAKGNYFAYQIGMAIWGLGGLMFCYLLYISGLVPRGLSVWGFIGYIVFIAGTIAELFGNKIGVQLALPGGLFEITLSIWLIVKGFRETGQVSA